MQQSTDTDKTTQPISIDIDDYELAEEEKDPEYSDIRKNVGTFNIFMIYYKKLNSIKENSNLFDGVNSNDNLSTNKQMEYLFNLISMYKNSNDTDKDILYKIDANIDIEKCEELYMILINDEPQYICKYLMPIFNYIATLEIDHTTWTIMPLKTL